MPENYYSTLHVFFFFFVFFKRFLISIINDLFKLTCIDAICKMFTSQMRLEHLHFNFYFLLNFFILLSLKEPYVRSACGPMRNRGF